MFENYLEITNLLYFVVQQESKSYYLDKLKSKVLLGWIDYFKKNKELLSIKKKRVNIHAIFGNSKDVSPMK